MRTRRAFWFTTQSRPCSSRSGAAASPCVSLHGDQPGRGLFCITRSSVKMVDFDFSDFAQRCDDRSSATCERLGTASINRST